MTSARPPSRGDQTRETLIQAALEVFGRSGFDAASTRAIAEKAGVNQALIGYHFGSKQGLYLGVFEHIVGQMQQRMAPVAADVMQRLESVPPDPDPDPGARRDLAVQLMLTVFDAYTDMIGEPVAAGWVRLILREQQDPTAAFQLLYDNIFRRLLALLSRLVAIACDLEETSEACHVRTLMILGQVLIFFVARGTTSRYMDWTVVSPDKLALIKKQFRIMLESQFSHGVTNS